MPQKFTIEFEREADLWFATSKELNCFIAHPDLRKICSYLPEVVQLVDSHDRLAGKLVAK